MNGSPAFSASGNIFPSRFVTPSGPFQVQQSVAGDEPIGISGEGTYDPLIYNNVGYAATAGKPVQVYGNTDVCLLECGASWVAGQLLMPDANGKGIPVDVTGTRTSGARAIDSCNTGEFARVQVELHPGT